jgi:hypothetical protein
MHKSRSRGTAAAAIAVASVGLMLATAAEARLTKFTVGKVTSPQFNGQTFGNVGAYEELRGTFSGEIDPFDRRSATITDILLAPRNVRGNVEYTATFTLLKLRSIWASPDGVLVYGVSNHGGRALGTGMIPVTPPQPPATGSHLTGHVYVASGWQGDLPSAQTRTSPPKTRAHRAQPGPAHRSLRSVRALRLRDGQHAVARKRTHANSRSTPRRRASSPSRTRPTPARAPASPPSQRQLGLRRLPHGAVPRNAGRNAHLPEGGFDSTLAYELVYVRRPARARRRHGGEPRPVLLAPVRHARRFRY